MCCVCLADQRLTHGSRFAFQGLDDGQDEVNVRHRFRLHITPLDVQLDLRRYDQTSNICLKYILHAFFKFIIIIILIIITDFFITLPFG